MDTPQLLDRELSWLAFNERVFYLATDDSLPLLERVRFAAIFASNMDEFFQVRVAGLERRLRTGQGATSTGAMSPEELLRRIRKRVLDAERRLGELLHDALYPALDDAGICIRNFDDLDSSERREAREVFWHQVLPQLSPMPLEAEWSFPGVPSLAIGLAVHLGERDGSGERYAYLRAPQRGGSRFVPVGTRRHALVPVESLMAAHIQDIIPWADCLDSLAFRAVRDADSSGDGTDTDLVRSVEAQLRRRRQGRVVRIEAAAGGSDQLVTRLHEVFGTSDRHVYAGRTLIDVAGLSQVAALAGFSDLRDPTRRPAPHPRLERHTHEPIFDEIARGDILIQHPYQRYESTVERFVHEAVDDPDVLAIKHTIYRTSDDTSVVPALIAARNRERRSVCLVEIKARFDELANLQWGRELENAGVQVSYGLPGLKTHMKAILVVRREADGVRRYAHIGTGNYNANTARQYTDTGLLTADPEICSDLADIFHWLTDGAPRPTCRKLLLAPDAMREAIVAEIARCRDAARAGQRARIRMKMNALVDPACIEALYSASRDGVQVDLNVRGICCLVPGREGLSSNIRVVSIVGRLLEHSRLYVFDAAGERRVFMGSADLMPRNLDHRVEVLAPVEDPVLQGEIVDMLSTLMADTTRAWDLAPDGTWHRRNGVGATDIHLRLQDRFTRAAGG